MPAAYDHDTVWESPHVGLKKVAAVRAGTFHSNLPKIVQTLRYAYLHKDKRTFADASEAKADWWAPSLCPHDHCSALQGALC